MVLHRFAVLATLALLLTLSLFSPVAAQIFNQAPTAHLNTFTSQGEAGALLHSNFEATDESVGNFFDLKLAGDWHYFIPRGASRNVVQTTAEMLFTTGNLPVLIENVALRMDAKWVNGGGSTIAPIPATSVQASMAIFEYNGGGQEYESTAGSWNVLDLQGNGFERIQQVNSANVTPFVLNPLYAYRAFISIETYITAPDFGGAATSVVTNEFGGDLSFYDGYHLTFNWQPVPEPSSIVTMLVGAVGLGVVRIRRKARSGK